MCCAQVDDWLCNFEIQWYKKYQWSHFIHKVVRNEKPVFCLNWEAHNFKVSKPSEFINCIMLPPNGSFVRIMGTLLLYVLKLPENKKINSESGRCKPPGRQAAAGPWRGTLQGRGSVVLPCSNSRPHLSSAVNRHPLGTLTWTSWNSEVQLLTPLCLRTVICKTLRSERREITGSRTFWKTRPLDGKKIRGTCDSNLCWLLSDRQLEKDKCYD